MFSFLKYLKEKRIINKSGLFDIKYYIFKYPNIRKYDVDPIQHYIKYGAKEGKNPNSTFDTKLYISKHKEIEISGINPLVHYILDSKKDDIKSNIDLNNSEETSTKLIKSKNNYKSAIVVYLEDESGFEKIVKLLNNIEEPYELYMLVTEVFHTKSKIKENYLYKAIYIDNEKNIPLAINKQLSKDKVDVFCNLRTKDVNSFLLNNNIGSNDIFSGIVHFFELNSSISIIGAALSFLNDKDFFVDGIYWERVSSFEEINKEVALVYEGDIYGDFYVEKLVSKYSIVKDKDDFHKKTLSLQKDLILLQNTNLFDENAYRYLNFASNDNFIDKLLCNNINVKNNFTNTRDEYKYIQHRMATQELHLINWSSQRNKIRKKDFISIIIPLYGQADFTDKCLNSIFSIDSGLEFEVILVNNSQNQEDINSLEKWKKNVNIKIIQNNENLNFALGCNLGFSRAIGDTVVFLNNDTTVTQDWLKELILPLENENISSVQPKLLYPDKKLQCMGIVFSDKSDIGYPIYQNIDISDEIINKERKFQAITAACIAIKADDFSLIRGFDTSYVNGQEDVDLCLRLNSKKNTMSYYAPKSTVYHYESKSKGRGKFVAQNRQTLLSKHKGKIVKDDKLYYAQDSYKVSEYKLDNQDYKELGIEVHTPILKKITESKSIDFMDMYYYKGYKNHIANEKNILLSTHVLSKVLYGGQRSFLDMLQAVSASGFNIIVTLPNNSNEDYIKMVSKYCVKIYIVKYKFWSINDLNNDAIDVLELIMKQNDIDLVYVNTIMCREPLLAAKKLNIKKIIHARELINKDMALKSAIGIEDSNIIIEEVKRNSDLIICNSKSTAQMFDNYKCKIVYNKVDIEEFSQIKNIDKDKTRFAIISGNEPNKGIFDFLELAKRAKNIKNTEFLIIGHKNQHIKEIEKEIDKYELNNLKILGYYDKPVEAIAECDVLINLSHVAESFGRTIAEAMAAKKAVIAYDYGALKELIDDGVTGVLCEYKNLDEVLKAVVKLSTNHSLLRDMGTNGYDKIKNISDTKIYNTKIKDAINMVLNFKKIFFNITVIVPIYNAYEEFINCADSLVNTLSEDVEILFINDCSSDSRISELLLKYNNIKNISVYENKQNLGYTVNINKAIRLAKGNDIVLLNSDTITTQGWLESLEELAYSEEDIGTVTAMSDNAGAFSFPSNEKNIDVKPKSLPFDNYAELVLRKTQNFSSIEVPTGSGFCLYVKRELIKDIGLFDEVVFPRGYGEENDFCLRAIDAGWKNVISTKTFIFHIRTASFKDEKKDLTIMAKKNILLKYPNYDTLIKEAFHSSSMKNIHLEASKALDICKVNNNEK